MSREIEGDNIEDEISIAEMNDDVETLRELNEEVYEDSSENYANINDLYDESQFDAIMASFDTIILTYGYPEVASTSVENKEIESYSQEESNLNIKNLLEAINDNEDISMADKERINNNIQIIVTALNKSENIKDPNQMDEIQFNKIIAKAESVINGLNKEFNINIDFNELIKSTKNLDMDEFNNDLKNYNEKNSFEI